MADLSIDIRTLVKRHGAVLAVDHVSLQIQRGEFFSLLGPSGAGKTSLLRMLAGFETPDAGEIFIDGVSMAGVPPNRRPVNLVFQSYALFPHMTVAGNIAFGLEMNRVSRRDIDARVGAALELVRLEGKRERMPEELSGGEQQRVALARALVNRPAVVLLDEPLAALDQQLRQQMQTELKAIQEQVGITFVCVTHHQEEALALSDRLAVLHQGRVMQVGSPAEVYERPANVFVAQFVGAANLLHGTITEIRSQSGILTPSQVSAASPMTIPATDLISAGKPAVLLLRPERVWIMRDPEADPDVNRLSGVVETIRYVGSAWQVAVRIGPATCWTVPVPNVSAGTSPFQTGSAVTVCWHASDGIMLSPS